ncbi:rhomboid-domain-containing protein [Stereum hirsutum FP-91666 SS1]|uniref:rhomboid-domain-containing protein n=1 Tax=Stereum hirsutum (strain FP-91666) TaxID=721885 RepID=UPI000440FB0F|nr:rhomboid-domain-containing protein [Stereum hirsutum FP-91666 SS1]EIM88239.1 rhomboid-domain-containing protein [Stereum hirsutum FP-91666 SS1]
MASLTLNPLRLARAPLSLRPYRLISTRTSPILSCLLANSFQTPRQPTRLILGLHPKPFSLSSRLNATHRDHRPGKNGPPRPPRRSGLGFFTSLRRFLDGIPPSFVVYGIMALNGIVFAGWWVAIDALKRTRDQTLYKFMAENFTSSKMNYEAGRWWTALTSCFSHQSFSHILFNGMTFYFMAPAVASILGTSSFLFLYLGGGIFSSLFSHTLSTLPQSSYKSTHQISSVGASGAIFSIISFFTCLSPRTTFLLFGIVPCPAWGVVAGTIAYDGYNSWRESKGQKGIGNTDGLAHIGGVVAGAVYFVLKMRGLRV